MSWIPRRSINWTKFRPQNLVPLYHVVQRGLQLSSVDVVGHTQAVCEVLSWIARMQLVQHPEAFLGI